MTHEDTNVIDTVVASIGFENGAAASVTASDAGQIPYLSKFSFQLYSNGVTAMVHNRCKSVSFSGIEGRDLDVADENFAGELQDLARCLVEGEPSPIPAEDGTRATALVLKAFESVRTGQPQVL
jgi:predicted dehydrogenase